MTHNLCPLSQQSATKGMASLSQQQQHEPQPVFSMQLNAIAIMHSVYNEKHGAARQGALVPHTRAYLQLNSSLSSQLLIGLEHCSHLIVIFAFHLNTNEKPKNMVRPPRCAVKVGALACRSPHRPNPIGSSVVTLRKVDLANKRVYVSGIDIVDGTPVLDIKPYHFCDYVPLPLIRLSQWVEPIMDDVPSTQSCVLSSSSAASSVMMVECKSGQTSTEQNVRNEWDSKKEPSMRIPRLTVMWTRQAQHQLQSLSHTLKFFQQNEVREVFLGINESLTLDPRSKHSRTSHKLDADAVPPCYALSYDSLHVSFCVDHEETQFIVFNVVPADATMPLRANAWLEAIKHVFISEQQAGRFSDLHCAWLEADPT